MAPIRKRMTAVLASALLALAANAANAEWQPQWSNPWQYPASHIGAGALRVIVTNTGETFAEVSVRHDQRDFIALMKFDATGNVVWLQENEGSALAGIVSTNGRITIAGEWGTPATPIGVRQYNAQTGELIWDHLAGGAPPAGA